jgi:DNA-binding response OmpR family regulator
MKKESNYLHKKILVVDDDQFILEFVKIVLTKEGFEIVIANNGQTGLEIAIEEKPDIILADLMMPVMDGAELCKKVKSIPSLHETLFLVLSAKTDKNDRIKLLNLGADDFITKPVSKGELIAKINAFVRIQNLQMEVKEKKYNLEMVRKELQKTTKNLQNVSLEIKETRVQLLEKEKLASIGQTAISNTQKISKSIHLVQHNLSVIKNYMLDIRALYSRYESIVDEVPKGANSELDSRLDDLHHFKNHIDIESIYSDFEKTMKESLKTVQNIQESIKNSDLVSNVELN